MQRASFGDIRLGVVCPMANEQATAIAFVEAVLAQCRSRDFASITFFAVLDRAGTDATRALLEQHAMVQPQLQAVWAPQNKNVVDAYLRGYREALAASCD